MRKERVNINLNVNNKKVGLIKEEEVKAAVDLTIQNTNLKLRVNGTDDNIPYPPAPPSSCDGASSGGIKYASLVQTDTVKCQNNGNFSVLKVTDDEKNSFGIKVHGEPNADVDLVLSNQSSSNLEVLEAMIGTKTYNLLLEQEAIKVQLPGDGVTLIPIKIIKQAYVICDLDGDDKVGLADINVLVNYILERPLNNKEEAEKRMLASTRYLEENHPGLGVTKGKYNLALLNAIVSIILEKISI